MPCTVLAATGIPLRRALEAHGVDPAPLFEQAGLDPRRLHDANARFRDAGAYRLWRLAIEATGDPLLGLAVAREWHPSAAHALGYAWLASATLCDAIERLVRYFRLLSDKEKLSLVEAAEELRLVVEEPVAEYPTAEEDYDASFAIVVDLCREICGREFNPLRITMKRPPPEDGKRFRAHFRAPIQFSGDENSICFDAAQTRRPVPTANAEVARASDRTVQEYLGRFDRSGVAMLVRTRLTEQLSSGHATQQSVARSLHMSLRSLQRRLAAEGTSYRELLEETRRELATHYMAESHLSLNEITYLLGFSEPSNFSRAFRRWTGESPSAYRVRVASP